MFHIRRYDKWASKFHAAVYKDEPATPETFDANVQQILLERETELPPGGKRSVVECMARLSRELRG